MISFLNFKTGITAKPLSMLLFLCLAFMLTGCDQDSLKSADKLYKEGKYDKALPKFMKSVESYRSKLNGKYSSLKTAQNDAAAYSEKCYFAAMCQKQLGNQSAANELFKLASTAQFDITETYQVSEQVWVAGSYKQVWVAGHYKDVYVDGHYEDVWVEGYKEEFWVDGQYDSDGNWVDGHYDSKWVDGHYDSKWIDGHYEEEWVEGYYEDEWVPAHYETVWRTMERPATVSNTSQYVSMSQAELKSAGVSTGSASAPATETKADNAARIKALRDEIDALQARRQELVESGANSAALSTLDQEITKLRATLSSLE